jgi:hypothetical protein
MIKPATLAVLMLSCVGPARADDRDAIFMANAAPITRVAEDAIGAVRCGLRSHEWGTKMQMQITSALSILADRLWPNGMTDDEELNGHDAALSKGYAAADAAAVRGKLVPPKWCVEVGPSIVRELDDIAARPLKPTWHS